MMESSGVQNTYGLYHLLSWNQLAITYNWQTFCFGSSDAELLFKHFFTMAISIDSTISQLLQGRHTFINNVILRLGKQSKATYITTAIALFVAKKIYNVLSCPKNLRHIAHVPAPIWLLSLMRGETTLDRSKRLLISRMTETNGMVSKFSQLGWEVTVMNPKAIKTLLHSTGLCLFFFSFFGLQPLFTVLTKMLTLILQTFSQSRRWRLRTLIVDRLSVDILVRQTSPSQMVMNGCDEERLVSGMGFLSILHNTERSLYLTKLLFNRLQTPPLNELCR